MDIQTLAIITLLGSFAVMIFLRFPIAYAVGLSSVLCLVVQDKSLMDVCRLMVKGISSFSLMAVPFFITMEDTDTIDGDGFPVQAFTVHILPAIYPDPTLPLPARKEKMRRENYEAWVRVYEEFYGIPLVYSEDSCPRREETEA